MAAARGEAFWDICERELLITIPAHIKWVCMVQGVDYALNFSEIQEADFIAFEDYIKSEEYSASISPGEDKTVYYGGQTPEDFKWSKDDLATFRTIRKFVTECNPSIWTRKTSLLSSLRPSNWKQSTFLNMLNESADKNRTRFPSHHVFEEYLKIVCAFIRIIAGSLLYGFFAANLPIPALSTIGDFIGKFFSPVLEGDLRVNELKEFLRKRNYPSCVWISEDATSIAGRVEYDAKSNQIVGFILPLNENKKPLCYSFMATSARAMGEFFEKRKKATLLYVFMAQPNDKDALPFCLMVYGTDGSMTFQDVIKRWTYISDILEANGIRVLGFSSDGDTRLTKAMRICVELGTEVDTNHKYYVEGFHAKILPKRVCIQDIVHVSIRLKVKFDKPGYCPMGGYAANSSDLHLLAQQETKDYHHLQDLDLTDKDKMNFGATIRVCHPRIWKLLKEHVPGSDATQAYLKIIFFSTQGMLNIHLNSLERIYCLWYSIYFLRMWRVWLLEQKLSLQKHFITSSAYTCLEINAHGLLNLVFQSLEEGESLPLFPWLYSSQACEGFFRNLRSICSTFMTVVNVSVLGALRRIKQIQMLSDVLAFCFGELGQKIVFPRTRFLNASNEKQTEEFGEIPRFHQTLSIDSIKQVMTQAKTDARAMAEALSMHVAKNAENELHLFHDSVDSQDLTTIVDDARDIQAVQTQDDAEDEAETPSKAELTILQNGRKPINLLDYSKTDKTLTEKSEYVAVSVGSGKVKFVKKSSLCWFLDNRQKLSSDRLLRVQQGSGKDDKKVHSGARTSVLKLDEIYVKDFCLFQIEKTSIEEGNCLIGLVYGFSYIESKKTLPQNHAKVHPDTRNDETIAGKKQTLGVLARWFHVDPSNNSLTVLTSIKHGPIPISQYRYTIPYPHYEGNTFFIQPDVYDSISYLLSSYE